MSDVIKGALIIGICIFCRLWGLLGLLIEQLLGVMNAIGIIFLIMLPAANTILAQINTAHSLSVGNSVGMAITTKKINNWGLLLLTNE